jgi:hypothetical protein
MTIYPIILIIVLCVMWTRMVLSIGKDDDINIFFSLAWSVVFGTLLWLCGFFHALHWPQITWICLTTIGCVISLYRHGGTVKNTLGTYVFTLAFMLFIYIKGGAFQYLNN